MHDVVALRRNLHESPIIAINKFSKRMDVKRTEMAKTTITKPLWRALKTNKKKLPTKCV